MALSSQSSELYAEVIHVTGAPLRIWWGFIDGTVRPVSRPGKNHWILYNGHKRVHAIKFQSIAAPNGLIANPLYFFTYKAQHFFKESLLDSSKSIVISGCII